MHFHPTQETIDVVKALGGTWRGKYAECACPAHSDTTPSLSITQGHTRMLVKCFAGCNVDDILREIRHIMGRSLTSSETPSIDNAPNRSPFRRIWNQAEPVEGTLAHRYLVETRGITFIPPDIRYHPNCPKGKGAFAQYLPALLVGIYVNSNLSAIQRLFIDPITLQKTGAQILGNSRTGIWPQHHRGQRVFIAEGFETACAFQQITARPGLPVSEKQTSPSQIFQIT